MGARACWGRGEKEEKRDAVPGVPVCHVGDRGTNDNVASAVHPRRFAALGSPLGIWALI